MNIQAPRDFIDRRQLVSALRALRRGDFSVRLPEEVDGVDGEIASIFNEVVSVNEEMTQEFERLSKVVGKEGKITQRGRVKNARGGWETAVRSVNELIEDMVQPTAEVARVIGAVAKGDLSQSMTVEIDGRPAARRIPAHRQGREHHGRAARLLRVGSDSRCPRSRHRRQARRTGQGEGRRRHLEGPHRQRQRDGDQPHRPGAQHRRSDHRRRPRRLVEEDHGRGEGRDPRAEEHDQRDGRPAERLRVGSYPRRPRGGHRRQARRPGAGGRRRRHVEGSDRQRQPHGRESDRPGAQHRRGHHGRRARRLVEEDHRRREGRDPRAQEHHQHDGRSAERLRLRSDARRARSRHRRQARRPGAGARRRRYVGRPHRQREPDGRQPHRPGAQHRRGDHRRRQGRPVEEDHRRREGRNSRAKGHHQHDGRPAQLVRLGSDARRPRSRVRRQAWRTGAGGRRRRHLGRPHRQRQPHGRQPDRPGPQHRRSDHRRRARRLVEEDHRRRARRNSRTEGHHQYDGGPAQRLRLGSDPRCARGRHRRQARRAGASGRRRRNLGRLDRQREPDGRQPDRSGAQHRRSDHRRRARRLVEEDHRRREGRDPRAQEHDQRHGRPAQRLRLGSDARRARSRNGRQARRSGAGARRRRHVEGLDRQRQRHGREPDGPGTQHRRGDDRGRLGRPLEEDHGRREGRDSRAQEHHQHDGRSAQLVRVRGDPRRARGRHRRQARRPGAGAGSRRARGPI